MSNVSWPRAGGSLALNVAANTIVPYSNLLPNAITASIVKTGPGRLELMGGNNLQNDVTITQGSLTLGDSYDQNDVGENGSVKGNVVVNNSAYLQFANSSAQTFAGNISGSGALQLMGTILNTTTGTPMIFSGNNTYTGETQFIYGGTLRAGSNHGLSAGSGVNFGVTGAILDLNGYDSTVAYLSGTGANANVTLGANCSRSRTAARRLRPRRLPSVEPAI